jgi:hypothetical protein
MYKIDDASAVVTKPEKTATGIQGYFAQFGNDPTRVTPDFLNTLQDEISHVIQMAGISNNKSDDTQLYQAILQLITNTNTFFEPGTTLPFFQAAAPTGWTRIIAHNDYMLRVVNTSGGSVGGTDSPILNNKVPAHTHNFSATTNVAGNHTHNYTTSITSHPQSGSATWCWWGYTTGTTSAAGDHSHTVSGTTANNTSASSWTPRYADVLLCSCD